jgi:hypothetical protein
VTTVTLEAHCASAAAVAIGTVKGTPNRAAIRKAGIVTLIGSSTLSPRRLRVSVAIVRFVRRCRRLSQSQVPELAD